MLTKGVVYRLVLALVSLFGAVIVSSQQVLQPVSCSIPLFTKSATVASSLGRDVLVIDFNKDGKADVVAVRAGGLGRVVISLGNGNGGLGAPTEHPIGGTPKAFTVGDFNGDSNLDIAVAIEQSPSEILILLNNGSGGFQNPIQLFLSNGQSDAISSVAVADINSDTKLDLVATSATFRTIFILRGEGNGQFTTVGTVPIENVGPLTVLTSDLNEDQKIDLIVLSSFASANTSVGALSTFLGDGAFSFSAGQHIQVGPGPRSLALADLNGDSKLDAAIANETSNQVTVLTGLGSGLFGSPTSYSSGAERPRSIVAGDFSADGKTDLAVFNARPGNLVLLINDGTGSFQIKAAFGFDASGSGFSSIVAKSGDFNADSREDLVVLHEGSSATSLLLNNCGAEVNATTQFSALAFVGLEDTTLGVPQSISVVVTRTGDITGSSSVDYATANDTALANQDYTAVSGTLSFGPGESFKAFSVPLLDDLINESESEFFNLSLSNGLGSSVLVNPFLARGVILEFDSVPAISISDVAVVEGNTGNVVANFEVSLNHASSFPTVVSYGTGNGSAISGQDFSGTSGTLTFDPGETSKTISITVNGDSTGEVNEYFTVNISNPGNGSVSDSQAIGTILDDDSSCPGPSFGDTVHYNTQVDPFDIAKGDFNGDSKIDLVIGNRVSKSVSLLIGDGSGGFATPVNFALPGSPQSLAVGDFNLDSRPDVITVNNDSSNGLPGRSLLLNNGSGGFQAAQNISLDPRYTNIVATDFNNDGKPDIATLRFSINGNGVVSVSFGDGMGSFGTVTEYPVGKSSIEMISLDLNGDNRPDLATANLNSFDISILLNNGDGTFGATRTSNIPGNPQSLVSGDFNSDGKTDILVTSGNGSNGTLSLLFGDGLGNLISPVTFDLGKNLFQAVAADLNGDGTLDLAIGDTAQSSPAIPGIWLLFGNGAGRFSFPVLHNLTEGAFALSSADFDGNGRLDLAFTRNNLGVVLNNCGVGPANSSIEFSASEREVQEGAKSISLHVVRSVNTQLPAIVSYSSSDSGDTNCAAVSGGASSRCDYLTTVGTLEFASGETSKTITIPIFDDSYREGDESFTLTLSDPSNARLGTTSQTQVRIKDNEAIHGSNPVNAPEFFVRSHYSDFLNRVPDQVGLDFWVGNFTECNGDSQCIEVKRVNVSAAFFLSIEFQETGYLVERIYKTAYGDAVGQSVLGGSHQLSVPIIRFNEFLRDSQVLGKGVVIGEGNWQQRLEDNKRAFVSNFVSSSRFLNALPLTMTPTEFVNKLNGNVGDVISSPRRSELINALTTGMMSRAEVVRAIAEDPALANAELNKAFVLMQYFGYLRRNPNDLPDSDYSGYDFWLTKLNQFNGNFVNAEMVRAFISSDEYRRRFGP